MVDELKNEDLGNQGSGCSLEPPAGDEILREPLDRQGDVVPLDGLGRNGRDGQLGRHLLTAGNHDG